MTSALQLPHSGLLVPIILLSFETLKLREAHGCELWVRIQNSSSICTIRSSVRHMSQSWHPSFSPESPDLPESPELPDLPESPDSRDSPDSPEWPDQLNTEFAQFIMSCFVQSYLILFPKNKIFGWFFLHTKWQRNVQYIVIKMYYFPLKCTNFPFKCTSFTLRWTNVTKM